LIHSLKTMNERLKYIREDYLKLKPEEFANRLGLHRHNIRDMENGKQNVNVNTAKKIEDIFSISGWWILSGRGEMIKDSKDTKISDDLIEVKFYDDILLKNEESAISVIAFKKEFLELQCSLKSFNNIYMIMTNSDCMAPYIKIGALLFINPFENENNKIKEGEIYLIKCDDSILIRRVAKTDKKLTYSLLSDNTFYKPMTISLKEAQEDYVILGRIFYTLQ